ncbi:hypothetical protein myaer102_11390 [Microcystis viridis NIES-102]|uniref:B12-binding domain-containing radical SAM protein n=1 Tax=Microcystis viridis NIES-102 TaxID=213615 RepID=A0A3G9K196_MICVR|nr:hypothetical protein myaer102_11390 [Microcystis viridis NIES-102]
MKALLLWPLMPNSFWSYQETLNLAGLRATNPPLGLITVAALLPSDWEIRFVDRNVRLETASDWEWCDLVIISAMIIQKKDFQPTFRTLSVTTSQKRKGRESKYLSRGVSWRQAAGN